MGQPALHLSPAQLIERWGGAVALQTLANWRSQRKGPPYIKFGAVVRYPIRQLEVWEAKNMHHANDNIDHTEPVQP